MSDWPLLVASKSLEWEKVGIQVLGAPAAAVTFSGIDDTYRRFMLVVYVVNDANNKNVWVRFNSDSGNNYAQQRLNADSTTVDAARVTGQSKIHIDLGIGLLASQAMNLSLFVAKPTAADKARVIYQTGFSGTGPAIVLGLGGAEWDNTSALLTSVAIVANSNNFAAGTRVAITAARNTV
jgi:hypothetical protein